MGLRKKEVLALTLSDFNLMYTGYKRRREDDWDIARRTWAYMISYGGMGLKDGKVMQHTEMMSLPFRDRAENEEITKITTHAQAIDLLKTF